MKGISAMKYKSLSHKELINRLGENPNDKELFGEFHSRYDGYICATLYKTFKQARLDKSIELQDLYQEVYQKLFANEGRVLRTFKSENEFAPLTLFGLICRQTVSSHKNESKTIDVQNIANLIYASQGLNHILGITESELREEIEDCLNKVTAVRREGKRDRLIFLIKVDGTDPSLISEMFSKLSISRVCDICTEIKKGLQYCLYQKGINPGKKSA